jgi:hypothetical protein
LAFAVFSVGVAVRTKVVASALQGPSSPIPNPAMLWSGDSAGLFILRDHQYAARLFWTSPELQDAMIKAVSDAGVAQFFVNDDPDMEPLISRLLAEHRLMKFGMEYGHDTYQLIIPLPQRVTTQSSAVKADGSDRARRIRGQ